MAKLPAGCRKLNNFCNALVRIARTLPLAEKSCELFSSSAAKDFFAVTLRQPYSKLAAGFSLSKGSAGYQSVFITISSICVSIFKISFDIFSWKGVGPIINQLISF